MRRLGKGLVMDREDIAFMAVVAFLLAVLIVSGIGSMYSNTPEAGMTEAKCAELSPVYDTMVVDDVCWVEIALDLYVPLGNVHIHLDGVK